MATPIIAAIRARRDLKESLQHTAQELAHMASIYGVAKVSYTYLAWKCRCCRQTIMNHIKKLIALKIIRKRVVWLKGNFCEVNTYSFLVSWDTAPARSAIVNNSVPTLPHQAREKTLRGYEGEKSGSLHQHLANQQRMLNWLYTPGSDQWQRTCEEIVYLEGLLAPGRAV